MNRNQKIATASKNPIVSSYCAARGGRTPSTSCSARSRMSFRFFSTSTSPGYFTARSNVACASRVKVFVRSEEHTSELQSQSKLVCRLLLEKKKPGVGRAAAQHHVLQQLDAIRHGQQVGQRLYRRGEVIQRGEEAAKEHAAQQHQHGELHGLGVALGQQRDDEANAERGKQLQQDHTGQV